MKMSKTRLFVSKKLSANILIYIKYKQHHFLKNVLRIKKEDIGSDKILNTFSKKQYLNSTAIIFATDKLNFLFSNSNFLLKKTREIGLHVFKRSKILKNIFKNYASEGKLSIK